MKKRESGFSRKKMIAALSAVLAAVLVAVLVFNGGFSWLGSGVIIDDEVPMTDGIEDELPADEAGLPQGEEGDVAGEEAQDEPEVSDGEPEPPADEPEAPLDELSAEEANQAAEERATDIEELGYIPDEIVVVYEENVSAGDQEAVAEIVGSEEISEAASYDSGDVALMDISDEITVETAIEMVQEDDAVKAAFPNFIAETFDEPSASAESVGASPLATGDEFSEREWQLSAINAFGAWSELAAVNLPSEPVKVAVLDTGASINHPDLTNILDKKSSVEIYWKDGKAYSRALKGDGYMGGSDIPQHSTHGTHVAGIIGAEAGNGGVLGVASGGATKVANKIVRVVSIDVFAHFADAGQPTATANDVFLGLAQAQKAGCSVINLSLGFYNQNSAAFTTFVNTLNNTIGELSNQGIVVVCAAGNNNTSQPCYPAACDSTIGVISVSKRGDVPGTSATYQRKTWETNGFMRSYFSNYGSWCDISAPGEYIYSSVVLEDKKSNGYNYMDGTSMACPVVTGTVAMMKAANPSLSVADVKSILSQTATDLSTKGKDQESGSGLVNAEAAVKSALAAANVPQPRSVQPHNTDPEPPADISSASISVSNLTYTGSILPVNPSVAFRGVKLQQGRDYQISVSPATVKNTGTYTVTIQGVGVYTGTAKATFRVEAPTLSHAAVTVVSRTYTGSVQDVSPVVKLNGVTLQKGKDYQVSVSPSTVKNAGTYTVNLQGIGSYSGTCKATFAVQPVNLSSAQVQAIATQKHTGKAVTPQPKVTWQGKTLTNGTDYSLSYANNVNAGTATVTITGKGNFTGKKSVTFAIAAPNISKWVTVGEKKYYYDANGKPAKGAQYVGTGLYYFNDAGIMQTGWVSLNAGTTWHYFDGTGRAVSGWQKISGKWYYFNPSTCKMAVGWQKIGGAWYYLKGSGVMATGWQKIGNAWYYLKGSGVMASNQWVGNYYLTGSGAMATNKWIGRYHVNSSGLWDRTR